MKPKHYASVRQVLHSTSNILLLPWTLPIPYPRFTVYTTYVPQPRPHPSGTPHALALVLIDLILLVIRISVVSTVPTLSHRVEVRRVG
jgi:hypothetical protein